MAAYKLFQSICISSQFMFWCHLAGNFIKCNERYFRRELKNSLMNGPHTISTQQHSLTFCHLIYGSLYGLIWYIVMLQQATLYVLGLQLQIWGGLLKHLCEEQKLRRESEALKEEEAAAPRYTTILGRYNFVQKNRETLESEQQEKSCLLRRLKPLQSWCRLICHTCYIQNSLESCFNV